MAALNSLNVRICPHTRITDETIRSLFSFDFQRVSELVSIRSWRNDEIPPRYIKYVSRDTVISVKIRHTSWPRNVKALYLDVTRTLGLLKGVNDPHWTDHLTNKTELGPLRREWATWDAKTLRRRSHEMFANSLLSAVENMDKALVAFENRDQNDLRNDW